MTSTTFTPASVLQKLCNYFEIVPQEFQIIGSKEDSLFITQAYIYCLYRFTDLQFTEIAETTCRTSIYVRDTLDKITARCKVDTDYRDKIIKVEECFE